MRSLKYAWLKSLVLLVGLLFNAAEADNMETGPDFDNLIRIAKQYGLPMSPPDSQLALATRGWTTMIEGRNSSSSRDPGIYQPAFVVKDKSETANAIAHFGWSSEKIRDRQEHRPATREFSLEKPRAKESGYVLSLSDPACFVTSIQIAERGETDKANQLYEQFAKEKYIAFPEGRESLPSPNPNPKKLLAHCIYQYLYETTLDAKADQHSILKKMTLLEENYPWLFSKHQQDYYAFSRHQFLLSLKASVDAQPAAPGSVEESLIKWSNTKSKYRHLGFFDSHNVECDSSARDIFWQGLSGMRGLATLKDDNRLTMHVQAAIMNSPERRLRLGDLAKQLLTRMSGSYTIEDTLKQLQDQSLSSDQFFRQAAVTRRGDMKITKVHEVPLRILSRLHPEFLADIALEVVEKGSSDVHLFSVSETIVASAQSDENKSLLLCKMFDGLDGLKHKRTLLQNLAKVDEEACVKRLIPILEALPADVDEPYWTCDEANFTHVVMLCQADEVWDVFEKAVKRSAVGLRMEMMEPMNYSYVGKQQLKRRVKLLSQFLQDNELRDKQKTPQKYSGPCAAFTIPKIEVRNFVARKIDSLLSEQPARPDEFWTEQQWATLREKVAMEIEQFEQGVEKQGD